MSNTIEKAPIDWNFIRQLTYIYENLKEQFSEPCKVQIDCFKDSGTDSCDINDMKEKVNDLVRLHKPMQER